MWLNKYLLLALTVLLQMNVLGQVTQMTTHQYGSFFSYGLSSGTRIPPETTRKISLSTPGHAVGLGGVYARNLSEFLWFQTGLEIHAREWGWECSLTGKGNDQATKNKSRETWLTLPAQALIYTGHQQGRIYLSAGPAFSVLLHKSWQEQTISNPGENFITTRNEIHKLKTLQPGFIANIGTEIELNPRVFYRIQLQYQNQWYRRESVGMEKSGALQLSLAVLWSK